LIVWRYFLDSKQTTLYKTLSSYLLNYIYTKSAWVPLFAKISASGLGILTTPSGPRSL